MHSITSKNNFGPKGIRVSYNNGSGVVNGYIVKQISHTRFKVSGGVKTNSVMVTNVGAGLTNGTRTFTVSGGTGTATQFTVTVAGGKIASTPVVTVAGNYTVKPTGVVTATYSDANWLTSPTVTVDSGIVGGATFTLVTAPTTTTIVKLAPTTTLAGSPTATTFSPTVYGYFTILVTPLDTATGAVFTGNYGASTATVVTAGTRYRVGDVLTASSGGATFTVATLSSTVNVIATVTNTSVGAGLTNGTRTFTVSGGTGTAAVFTATVAGGAVVPASIVITNVGSYSVLPSPLVGATVTVDTGIVGGAAFTLTSATAGAIATVSVTSPGNYTAILSNPVSVTGGALGSSATATLNLTYLLNSITATGGTNYLVGQTLTFTGLTGTTPTASIASVSATGAPLTFTITAGSNISVFATSITKTASSVPAQHVKKIFSTQIRTTEGNDYKWSIFNVGTTANTVTMTTFS